MPSLPASAKPASAALSVCEEETLIAGEREGPRLRGVEHLGVLLGGGDRHGPSLVDRPPWPGVDRGRILPMIRGMRASALGLGLALVLALLLGGCAGKTAGRAQPGSGSESGSVSRRLERLLGEERARPRPRVRRPQGGGLPPDDRGRVARLGRHLAPRQVLLDPHQRGGPRRLPAPADHGRHPGGQAPGRGQAPVPAGLPAGGRRHARGPGHLDPHVDAVHARPGTARTRRPLGALRRRRPQRRHPGPAARRSGPLLAHGVPESLRICQTATGSDVSCSQPHAFRVEAVYQAVGGSYPNTTAYTPVARARCRQLMGSFGGYWQPPSPAGWAAGDRFVRCLRPTKG